MTMTSDSFWLIGVALTILQIISIFVSCSGFILIKFNDLKHLGIDVKTIKDSQERTEKRMDKLEIAHATIKAVCEERHVNRRRKSYKIKI